MSAPRAISGDRRPRCPTCGTPVTWEDNPVRPFCSLPCRLVDLSRWLDERHRVPGPLILPDVVPVDK